MSAQKGEDHRYTVGPTKLCKESASCTMETALNVVNEESVPIVGMFSGEKKDGTLILLINNPITHVVDKEAFAVWNITQPEHDFHPGTVRHQLYRENGNIMLFTEGLGSGKYPEFNNIVGKTLLSHTHVNSQQRLSPVYRPIGY